MTLTYEGSRRSWNHGQYRNGTFAYDHETEDMEKVEAVFEELRQDGWKIDDGVQDWGCCMVLDKDEFNDLKADFIEAKRHHHLR